MNSSGSGRSVLQLQIRPEMMHVDAVNVNHGIKLLFLYRGYAVHQDKNVVAFKDIVEQWSSVPRL